MATSKMIDATTTLQEITGVMAMFVIADDKDHLLEIGRDTFQCEHCGEDHPLVMIREENHGGAGGVVALLDNQEATRVIRFIAETFGLVSGEEWDEALAHIAERRALGATRLGMQA